MNLKTLNSQFTITKVKIDGIAESVWDKTKSSQIVKTVSNDNLKTINKNAAFGDVRSLWDGALLYLLINVNDKNINLSGRKFLIRMVLRFI